MQINAAKMKANAVLLHPLRSHHANSECYRQAVCLGSALNVTAQRGNLQFAQIGVIRSPYKENLPFPAGPGWFKTPAANTSSSLYNQAEAVAAWKT